MRNIIFWSGMWNREKAWDRNMNIPYSPTLQYFYVRPMASYQLAHWLRKHRFECQVIEFLQHLTADEIVEFTEGFITKDTIAIAITTTFWPFNPEAVPKNIALAATKIRAKYPKLKFIGGGPKIELYVKKFKFDKIFLNEAEDELLKWCQEQSLGMSLPNVKFDIKENDHIFIEEDCIVPNEVLPIELARGCMFKCTFCAYRNIGKLKGTYLRDPKYIRDSMLRNRDLFGTTNYIYLDDTVNEDADKVRSLAQINKELDYKINWSGFLRADLIWAHKNHDDLLESGLKQTFFGMESFHKQASVSIGKGWNGKYAKDWLPILHDELWKRQIGIHLSFIVGLPYEDMESYEATAKWLLDHPDFLGSFNTLGFGPESELGRNPERWGYKVTNSSTWVNEESKMDSTEAARITNYLMEKIASNRILAGFILTSLSSLGYTHEETLRLSDTMFIPYVDAKKDAFMDTYKSKIRNLINKR